MEFRRFLPPPDLEPWIECAWVLRGALGGEGHVVVADGRLELIFHLADRPLAPHEAQPSTLVAGRGLDPLLLRSARVETVGVRLRPEAAGCVLPASELAQFGCMEAVLGRWAREVRERLGNAYGDADRMAVLWQAVQRLIRDSPDPAVAQAVRRIERAGGRGAVSEFVPGGLQLRQCQRRFLQSSGFSMKQFARITRVQRAIGLARAGERSADVSLEAGYYDQAHLVNEVRALSGCTPRQLLSSERALAEFYRDAFFQDGFRVSA